LYDVKMIREKLDDHDNSAVREQGPVVPAARGAGGAGDLLDLVLRAGGEQSRDSCPGKR
jgi:hypothetical protein